MSTREDRESDARESDPRYIKVVNQETGLAMTSFDVTGKSDRHIERLVSGLVQRVDLDRYVVVDSADEVAN